MAKKNAVCIIKSNPFSWKTFEALRQAVGMAMDHNVSVVFIKDGVFALTNWHPEMIGVPSFDKSIEALAMLGGKIYVDKNCLDDRGIVKLKDFGVEIFTKSEEEVCKLIKSAEVVLIW
ncbi:MAG: DsrE family protein [Sulfurihydrogenibium sp.]|jgi:tRNA 2-thiouridine synthesizing protein C|uniref:DsrE family protein n=1 Tax=Sulfurihydrogenibium sp. TaxID=2053621 RepID=UPI000CB58736|nr:MAG: sulfur reduction protein DsrE [Sulfurihydrogenibium sp.]PMP76945.1 MAG: sulfur reduction protein DsrE [Sulfurihydrogenibium sp.]